MTQVSMLHTDSLKYHPVKGSYIQKWGRKQAAEVLLGFQIDEVEKILDVTLDRLEYLKELKKDVDTW